LLGIAVQETLPDKHRIENDKLNYRTEIEHLQGLKNTSTLKDYSNIDYNNIGELYATLDKLSDKEKSNLIHKHIKSVSVLECENNIKKINVETYIDYDLFMNFAGATDKDVDMSDYIKDNAPSKKTYQYDTVTKKIYSEDEIIPINKRIKTHTRKKLS
jgi:hypothetical protein